MAGESGSIDVVQVLVAACSMAALSVMAEAAAGSSSVPAVAWMAAGGGVLAASVQLADQ